MYPYGRISQFLNKIIPPQIDYSKIKNKINKINRQGQFTQPCSQIIHSTLQFIENHILHIDFFFFQNTPSSM